MRRFISVGLLAAGAVLMSSSGAAAKWVLDVEANPDGLRPGAPWRFEIEAVGSHFPRGAAARRPPVVEIVSREHGIKRSFVSRAVPGARRRHAVTVRFPAPGRWRYAVRWAGVRFGPGGGFEPGRVVILEWKQGPDAALAAPSAAGGGGVSSWPIAAAAGTLLLLAGAVAHRRRRALGHADGPELLGGNRDAAAGVGVETARRK